MYKGSDITSSNSTSVNTLNEDVLTQHLLKLNKIEDQFRELTNRFEEVNFKIDKLSNRVTKIQTDSQLRFNDLETGVFKNTTAGDEPKKKAKLPGTDAAQDFGQAPGYKKTETSTIQKTQSIETAATVVTETPEKTIFSGFILAFKATINSPLDTTSAPKPNLPIKFKIFEFEFDFTEKQINGFISLKFFLKL